MNDPLLLAKKFDELIVLAREAESGFEKAAVYAAAEALSAAFASAEESFDSYALEKVEQARWHISAAVGYDVTNGHASSQHLSWAMGAVSTLQNVLSRSDT